MYTMPEQAIVRYCRPITEARRMTWSECTIPEGYATS